MDIKFIITLDYFKFNLPFIGDLLTFKITGETKGINYYSANQKLS